MTPLPSKTGVIGHPIAHSKSPVIHSYWLDLYNINGSYEAIDINAENLKQNVLNLVKNGFSGFNVTVPHKVAIMDLCNGLDDTSKAIGAVNTVQIKEGKLYGSNTDSYGFIQNIKETIKRNHTGWNFTNGPAIVLGAGGAAKAICHGLIENGVPEIHLTNRTKEKAEQLVQSLDPSRVRVHDWDQRNSILNTANLIVNTTSLGMVGKPPLDINLSSAPKNALVTDIVYAPLMTELLTQAQNLKMPIVTGIGMLLHQARPGFELWHGIMPNVTADLERLVLK